MRNPLLPTLTSQQEGTVIGAYDAPVQVFVTENVVLLEVVFVFEVGFWNDH